MHAEILTGAQTKWHRLCWKAHYTATLLKVAMSGPSPWLDSTPGMPCMPLWVLLFCLYSCWGHSSVILPGDLFCNCCWFLDWMACCHFCLSLPSSRWDLEFIQNYNWSLEYRDQVLWRKWQLRVGKTDYVIEFKRDGSPRGDSHPWLSWLPSPNSAFPNLQEFPMPELAILLVPWSQGQAGIISLLL